MAKYGEWVQKGAALSNVTAQKEYGVTLEFIEDGIRAGKLEYRHAAMHGNPYIRILRSQLELYIAEQVGTKHLKDKKAETELRKVKAEIASLKKQLTVLAARKQELEEVVGPVKARGRPSG